MLILALLLSVETCGVGSMQLPVVIWVAMGGHLACSLVCTGADSAGRYDAVALHVTVCKPRFGPHMPTDLRCQELPI